MPKENTWDLVAPSLLIDEFSLLAYLFEKEPQLISWYILYYLDMKSIVTMSFVHKKVWQIVFSRGNFTFRQLNLKKHFLKQMVHKPLWEEVKSITMD